jgi:hypothetical protein
LLNEDHFSQILTKSALQRTPGGSMALASSEFSVVSCGLNHVICRKENMLTVLLPLGHLMEASCQNVSVIKAHTLTPIILLILAKLCHPSLG